MFRFTSLLVKQQAPCLQRFISNSANSSIIINHLDSKTGFQTVNLNNPPVNFLSSEVLTHLVESFDEASKNNDVKGIIVKAQTTRQVFSAGLNIEELYGRSEKYYKEYWYKVQNWYFSVYGCKKPVVSVINGHAPAAGCALALMTDYRILMDGCGIGLNAAVGGIVPPLSISQLLIDAAGFRIAERGMKSGKLFSSTEALNAGIVDCVLTSEEEMVTKAEEKLHELCSVPASAFASTKMLLRGKNLEYYKSFREKYALEFAKTFHADVVQNMIGNYLNKLRTKTL